MAQTKIYKFKDIVETQHFLNGGVMGAPAVPQPGSSGGNGGNPTNLGIGIVGLVGKTFKLTKPSVKVVTFVVSAQSGNPDPNTLMPADLKAQIEAVAADVKVFFIAGRLAIIEAAISGGVQVDHTGTATAILGFDSAADTIGKVFAPPPSAVAPAWTWAGVTNDNAHVIYTLE